MIGIYCFQNKINGKCYIGQSINLKKRYNEHKNNHLNPNYCNYNSKFYRALRKYGFENFNYYIICECLQDELNEKEQFFIRLYNSKEDGYNSTFGGEDNPSFNKEVVSRRTLTLLNDPVVNAKLSHQGETNGNAKLSQQDIIFIRQAFANGASFAEVYKQYNNRISYSGFQQVWTNKSWTNIGQEYYTKRTIRNSGGSKLTEQDIRVIRTRIKNKEDPKLVYEDYKNKIGTAGFKKIINYTTWKDVIV